MALIRRKQYFNQNCKAKASQHESSLSLICHPKIRTSMCLSGLVKIVHEFIQKGNPLNSILESSGCISRSSPNFQISSEDFSKLYFFNKTFLILSYQFIYFSKKLQYFDNFFFQNFSFLTELFSSQFFFHENFFIFQIYTFSKISSRKLMSSILHIIYLRQKFNDYDNYFRNSHFIQLFVQLFMQIFMQFS